MRLKNLFLRVRDYLTTRGSEHKEEEDKVFKSEDSYSKYYYCLNECPSDEITREYIYSKDCITVSKKLETIPREDNYAIFEVWTDVYARVEDKYILKEYFIKGVVDSKGIKLSNEFIKNEFMNLPTEELINMRENLIEYMLFSDNDLHTILVSLPTECMEYFDTPLYLDGEFCKLPEETIEENYHMFHTSDRTNWVRNKIYITTESRGFNIDSIRKLLNVGNDLLDTSDYYFVKPIKYSSIDV